MSIRPPAGASKERATIATRQTRLRSRAFELLKVNPKQTLELNS